MCWGGGGFTCRSLGQRVVLTLDRALEMGAALDGDGLVDDVALDAGGRGTIAGLSAVPTRAGAQITFVVSSAAQVRTRVLNIAGRPVRTVCSARDCEAGTNTLVWNAHSDSGLPVPNGTYVVELAAKSPDGTQAKALTQVRINR